MRGRRQILYTKIIEEEAKVWQTEIEAAALADNAVSHEEKIKSVRKASDQLNAFTASNLPTVEIMASDYVRSCLSKLQTNHESTLDRIGESMLRGVPREVTRQAEKEVANLFNERDRYLNDLYMAARVDMGAAPQGANPCPQ